MRDLLLHTHVRLRGQQDIAASLLPFARHQLQNLVEQARSTGAPNLVRKFKMPGSVTGGIAATVEVRVMGAQHFIDIEAEKGCKDKLGFLLTRTPEDKYDARYNDGFVERIEPVEGTPRPDPDPAVRTVGYKVPGQLRQSPNIRVQASKFSGLMRLVVGCYHGRSLDAPFSFSWGRTHGIVKLNVDVGNPPVPTPRYWIVEISSAGVFAAPIKNTGQCCDSWSVAPYLPTAKEIEAQPSLEQNKTTLSLAWAFSVGRKNVLELLTAGDVVNAFSNGSPWYPDCGWAFSASGAVAQNVVQSEVGSPPRFLMSRLQLAFSVDSAGVLSATLSFPELGAIAQFPEYSGVWKPQTYSSWKKTKGLTPAQQQSSVYTNQDAPIHVYYVGEDAIVTRWQLSRANKGQVFAACSNGYARKQFAGTPPYCRLITTDHVGVVCQGLNSSPSARPLPINTLVFNGDGLDTGPDAGFIVHNGTIEYGGQLRDTGPHAFTMAGFVSPVSSNVLERSSKSVQQRDTKQGADETSFTESPSMYQLHSSCYYFANHCPPQPGDPVLITFAPVVHRITNTTRIVYNETEVTTETLAARTTLVLFLTEREAAMHVFRSTESKAGTKFNESLTGGVTNFRARIRTKTEKVGEAATPGWPAGCLTSPFVNWEAPISEAIDAAPGAVDTTVNALNTYAPSATAMLGVGSVTAGTAIPVETVPGGLMPLSNLSPFLKGSFNQSPEPDVEVGSLAFAQHGNLYYDDPALIPVNQATNATYLLLEEVVTVGGFDPAFTEAVAFVGKA